MQRRSADLQRVVDLRGGSSDGSPGRLQRLAAVGRGGDDADVVHMGQRERVVERSSIYERQDGSGSSPAAQADAAATSELAAAQTDARAATERADRACQALQKLIRRADMGAAALLMTSGLEWIERAEALMLEWIDSQRQAQVREFSCKVGRGTTLGRLRF